MASGSDDVAYEFGPFRLLPQRQLLLCQGLQVQIGFKALDILIILVTRSGEVVSKEELTQRVWPDTYVHESNLKVNVAALRRALGERRPFGPYIVNVPRRGYRFAAPVRVMADDGEDRVGDKSFVLLETLPDCPAVIGRSVAIAEMSEALAAARCVSIVGPGGVGKTTIAVALAHAVAERFDGICFIDFSTVGEAQYVGAAIGSALGIRSSARDMLAEIVDVLRARRVLVVLDNCEHVTSTVAGAIEQIVAAAPECRILATSREPLRVHGEYVYRLAALDVPDDVSGMSSLRALDYPAIDLFVVTAACCSNYALTEADVAVVASICRHLDGLPLAIKLAAAKTIAFTPAELLDMLEERFHLLNHGPRDAPLRHQTLLATLDWSYQLLSDDEAWLLRHLSAFAGFFGLQEAIALASDGTLLTSRVIDALGQLVAKSLVAADYQDGELRYRLLETTRAYAAERLAMAGEAPSAMERYARRILAIFIRGEEEWSWRSKRDWLAAYGCWIDDLRKAMGWAFSPLGKLALGVELTTAAIPLWDELSSMCESRSGVARALAAVDRLADCSPTIKMKLAAAYAWSMTFAQHLVPEAEAAWRNAIRYAQEAHSVEYHMRALWGLSVYLIYTGRHADAITLLEHFDALAAQSDPSARPDGERLLATAEIYRGRIAAARRRLEALAGQYAEEPERSRTSRFQLDRTVAIRCSFCFLLWLTGRPGRAADVAYAAVAEAQRVGHIVSQSNAIALGALPVAFWLGDYDRAAALQAMLDDNNRRENLEIWGPLSRFFGGAIQCAKGDAAGIVVMQGGLADLVIGRFLVRVPMYHSMLAQALLADGQIDAAETSIDDALWAAEAQGEQWCMPEVLRVRGDLLRCRGLYIEAEESLLGALEAARATGAVAFELRAAMSLFEFWSETGRDNHGRELLRETISKFVDGGTSADLSKGRALLGS